MSRVRFRQNIFTDTPKYKKRTKKRHPLSTIQPFANKQDFISNNIFGILNDNSNSAHLNIFQTLKDDFNDFMMNQKDNSRINQDGNHKQDEENNHKQNEVRSNHDDGDSRIIQDYEVENNCDNNDDESNDDENDRDNNDDENDHDENDRDDNDDENDHDENDHENDHDESTFKTYDDSPHLPHYQGDYGPYFPTFTAMALFIWVTKHMISSVAYKDLISILLHEKFRVKDVVKSMRSIKRFRGGLPLMTIKSHNVKLSSKDTPSTSKTSKEAYFFSVTDHIKRLLSNPKLRNCLYFGEGIETDSKSEFWHGELWQQSPLFGAECYCYNNVNYYPGEFIKYIGYNTDFQSVESRINLNKTI